MTYDARSICPRCGHPSLFLTKHKHSRWHCSASSVDGQPTPCPAYEGECKNPKCEYPGAKGGAEWARKHPNTPFWVRGKFVSVEAARIFGAPIEPLPFPYNGVVPE